MNEQARDVLSAPESALQRLLARQPVLGVLQALPSATVTELALWSGYDFVMLDCEHALVDEPAQLGSLQVIAGSPAFAAVRVRPGDLSAVGRYLEFGADCVLMPDVQTPQEAAAFVAAATYGPVGTRSSTSTGTRATRYGLTPGSAAPERGLLLALIEGRRGVDHVEAIAATPGLDGLVIGSHDLSADLGSPGVHSTPEYQSAFARIERAAKGSGLILGGGAHPDYPLERLAHAGFCFLLASVDFLALREGYRAHLETARRSLSRAREWGPLSHSHTEVRGST